MTTIVVPEKLKPFISLGFDFEPSRVSGKEAFGDCIFCGRTNKMYLNTETGQWSCKSGKCGKEGNTYTFLQSWYDMFVDEMDEQSLEKKWQSLSENRGIPVSALRNAGLIWDGERWTIPIRNIEGSMVGLRVWTPGKKVMGLPTIDAAIFNLDVLKALPEERVFLCEGEFDAIAANHIIDRDGGSGVAIGVPGAAIFKDTWSKHFSGKEVVVCYDAGEEGQKGVKRVYGKLCTIARNISYLAWPDHTRDGYDVRDLLVDGGNYGHLRQLIQPYVPPTEPLEGAQGNGAGNADGTVYERPKLREANRPDFEGDVLPTYRKWLYMTSDMEDALRIIYAVVYSNQIDGDPLWVHLVGPPGAGKTELLMSLTECSACYIASTLTAHSLVSGFQMQGGADPSLIPRLDGKAFILKDFTEVLKMQRTSKDEIYSILRGAFDGEVNKVFGNGLTRHYKSRFSMISGVTQSIFAEQGASLGERFLMYHVIKGVGFDADKMIQAAIGNAGDETEMKTELATMAHRFLEVEFENGDIPELDDSWQDRLVALSQFVSMLRAGVERDFTRERLAYRAQHEVGTRLAKQFKKLIRSLAMLSSPPVITPSAYRIVVRCAMDTCIGFNLEIIKFLIKTDGVGTAAICGGCRIPHATAYPQIIDMEQLGVLRREKVENPSGMGSGTIKWWITDRVKELWKRAGLS